MHLIIFVIALALVTSGVVIQQLKVKSEIPPQASLNVLGQFAPTSPTPPVVSSLSHTPSLAQNPVPPTPTTRTSSNTQSNLSDYIYHGAMVISQSQTAVALQSADDPQRITNWYKERIKERGMSTRSFVQTKTNDVVHNVLAASSQQETIRVVITKNPGESSTSIAVTR